MHTRHLMRAGLPLLGLGSLILALPACATTVTPPPRTCKAPAKGYPRHVAGRWISVVRSGSGRVTSYGVVNMGLRGRAVTIRGTNYGSGGQLKYHWRGTGTFDGTTLRFRWTIDSGTSGRNVMSLGVGNARLTGNWYQGRGSGAESYCRATNHPIPKVREVQPVNPARQVDPGGNALD